MVTRGEIEALAARIAAEFRPRLIVLFGSHAYGTPREDSDVDLLVVMAVNGPRYQAAAGIRTRLPVMLAIDVLVRTPADYELRRGSDPILVEALQRGVTLYSAAA